MYKGNFFSIVILCTALFVMAGCSDGRGSLDGNNFDTDQLTSATCEAQIEAFSPCGGNLVGTWMLEDNCTFRKDDRSNNYEDVSDDYDEEIYGPWCPERRSSRHQYYRDLEWTFGSNGTFIASSHTVIDTWTTVSPLRCLENVARCEDENDERTVCSGEAVCKCTSITDERSRDAKRTTYETAGSTLLASEGRSSARYCVQGQTLLVFSQESGAKYLRRFRLQ